jgi:hypothetical protein
LARDRSARYAYYHCRKCGEVRVNKSQLEARFVDLLLAVQPTEGYMRLFREIVLEAWSERRSDATRLRQQAQARADALRTRLDKVEDAFLYAGTIDRQSYERQRDRLRSDIVLAELEAGDAKAEEIDLEGVLAFADGTLTKIALLWTDAPVEKRRALQNLIFPQGLTFDHPGFGTAVTCLAFTKVEGNSVAESGLASPPGPLEGGVGSGRVTRTFTRLERVCPTENCTRVGRSTTEPYVGRGGFDASHDVETAGSSWPLAARDSSSQGSIEPWKCTFKTK